MTTLLLVEDDAAISGPLARALGREGYTVNLVATGRDALDQLTNGVDIMVLDLGLPDMDGLEVARQARGEGHTFPILILTARTEEVDMVVGLDSGADDYVTKPFHIEEVAARMQALLRRNSGLASQVISLPPFQVDLSRRELSVNDQPIKLTAFEYTIMETLIRNRGKVVSKDSLMLQLYPDAELRESHTIDVLMGRLRKKIQAEYPQDVITTVRGQGYLFELR